VSARRALLTVLLFGCAIAGSWLLPGWFGRGVGALVAQPPASPDTIAPPTQGLPPDSTAAPVRAPVPLAERLTGVLGLAAIIGLGVALSRDRRSIRWRVVAWGLGLQVTFAIFVLRVPAGQALFRELGAFVTAVLHYSYAGSAFVFGELGKPDSKLGVVFALQILPAIIYV